MSRDIRAWLTQWWAAPLLSLSAAWLFFVEYLKPFLHVHLIWDIGGYHYPLLNYAFKMLRAGHFPEWDPSIYCGVSYAGNVQAQLFYPPTWLLFAANWKRGGLSFNSIQIYVALHFALALLLAVLWLRGRGLGRLAAACGGLSFAFSGFFLGEIQHLGATAAVTWFPLAFWGIDQAGRERSWRPLWKVAAASALSFLAGFPFVWVVLCVCVLVYAAALAERLWLVPSCLGALAASMAISMVQVLPAAEAASMKVPVPCYGGGFPNPRDFLTLFMPNYFNHARSIPPGIEEPYMYLGAAALFGMGWFLWRRGLRAAAPAILIVLTWLVVLRNPFHWIENLLARFPPLNQMVREWQFFSCLPVAAALLVGVAVDDFLRRPAGKPRAALTWIGLAVMAGWAARELAIWARGGEAFLSGWASLWETAAALAAFIAGLFAFRAERRTRWRAALAAALLLLVWTDLKVYGTDRRFSAALGDVHKEYAGDARLGGSEFIGLDRSVYERMRSTPTFRMVMNENPTLPDLRHYLLRSPQGSDPLYPAALRDELGDAVTYYNSRSVIIDPLREDLLRRLAVRYVMTMRHSPQYQALIARPRFRLLAPDKDSFFAVFEYLDAEPSYRWPAGTAAVTRWTAEEREFRVESVTGGNFALIEQFYPGWHAFLDGRPLMIRRYSRAFQQVTVPPGTHRLRFEYRARGMRAGAAISLASCIALFAAVRFSKRRARRQPQKSVVSAPATSSL